MVYSAYWMEAKEKIIGDLQKDIKGLRAVVKAKDDIIKDMNRQMREKDTRIKLLEIDLKMAKDLSDLHKKFFEDAIKPKPFQEPPPITSTTRLRTTL